MGRQLIASLKHKIHQNYLMRSRVPDFQRLLEHLKRHGYVFMRVADMAAAVSNKETLPERLAVIRCDIDSDVRTAMDMFQAAANVGVAMTWYWRLSTLDKAAMAKMAAAGQEIGYHFEELATAAKRSGARTAPDMLSRLDVLRADFCRNLEDKYLPAAGELPKTVASHGDFVNRILRQTNSILVDEAIRTKYGIAAEAYDDWLNALVTRRYSDTGPPLWWKPGSPMSAPPEGSDVIYVLVHPRQFRARWIENTMLDIQRLVEGLLFKLRSRR